VPVHAGIRQRRQALPPGLLGPGHPQAHGPADQGTVEPGQGLPGEDHRELVPADDAGQSDEQPVPCQAALGVRGCRKSLLCLKDDFYT
jgi:hypothetical protein